MASSFYVTATGPVTLSVSGRIVFMQPGESQGPFSETEIQQILNSTDRSRILAVPAKDNPPVLEVPAVNMYTLEPQAPTPPLPTELYTGVTLETSSKAPESDIAAEPLDLNPPTVGSKVEAQPVYDGPVINEPEVEGDLTSQTQLMEESKEEEPQPGLVTNPEEEESASPTTRSRRRKTN